MAGFWGAALNRLAPPTRVLSVNAHEEVRQHVASLAGTEALNFDSTIRYDASFFQNLDRIVQTEPWLQRDQAMIDQLKPLGIEKGKPFSPNQQTTRLPGAAVREAGALLEGMYDKGWETFSRIVNGAPPLRPRLSK